jgi:hypothetical protein
VLPPCRTSRPPTPTLSPAACPNPNAARAGAKTSPGANLPPNEVADFAQKRAAFFARYEAQQAAQSQAQPPASVEAEAPLPNTLAPALEPAHPVEPAQTTVLAAPEVVSQPSLLPVQPEASPPEAKPRRKPSEQVTLFGETWERFSKGILPLSLLKDLAMALEDSARFRMQEDLVHEFVYPEDSAKMWHFSRTARHDARAGGAQ